MARWLGTLDISKVWKSEDPRLISAEIAKRLRLMLLYSFLEGENNRLLKAVAEEIVEEFQSASETEGLDVEDFDDLMQTLYDWADSDLGSGKKLCWIKTS